MMLLVVGCGRGTETREIQGILLDVRSRDLVEAESITLRSEGGSVHVFAVAPEVASDPDHATTASHLRQHMTIADPVIVRYRSTSDGPVAVQIRDVAR